jgi:histone H2B
MAPKPASTAGKAPASTASKAPAKSTEGAKAAKKTSKAAAPADGEKKKRKKVRKETYSSYIYKGEYLLHDHATLTYDLPTSLLYMS